MKVIPRHTEEVILNVVQSQTSNIIMFHLLMKTVIFLGSSADMNFFY